LSSAPSADYDGGGGALVCGWVLKGGSPK